MAALWKLSFILISVAVCVALSSSEEVVADANDAVMFSDYSDSARARPGWLACNFTETPGASCYDCNTRLICKKFGGGFLIPCWWPTKNNCVDGDCVAAPSEECASGTTTETSPSTEPASTLSSQE